ncbi:hypothetical protein RN70_01290 [Staphylococcus schleiferi]|nr:hypothetical protein RN70_01290 [Staphylococcus schleiferi]
MALIVFVMYLRNTLKLERIMKFDRGKWFLSFMLIGKCFFYNVISDSYGKDDHNHKCSKGFLN